MHHNIAVTKQWTAKMALNCESMTINFIWICSFSN